MENFKNVIGYEAIKMELNRLIDCINNKDKYVEMGIKRPKNLLLYGVPGVGKTLLANEFMAALNSNKYTIRKNKPDGEFVNEIKRVVNEAMNNTPSVVLFDDLDKFSNNDEKYKNSDEFVAIQSLIDEGKNKDIFFIATCNEITRLPSSLLRSGRFSTKIRVDNPTLKDAGLIIKHYLSDKKLDNDVNYEEIARILDGRSNVVLEEIMNEAGIIACYRNKKIISMEDIIGACLRVIFNAPKALDNKTKEQLTIAAYHEAGHAIVAEVLEAGSVNLVTIDNYFGSAGGITSSTMDVNYWWDIEKMENRIRVLLAGKAATELALNIVDTGSQSDIARAKAILERFQEVYGIDNFLSATGTSSDPTKVRHEIWQNIRFNDYYREAKSILFNHKDKLLSLASYLMEHSIIFRNEIANIMRKDK